MDIAADLNGTVVWEAKTGEDDWGNPSHDPPVELPAFVDEAMRRVRTASGDEVTSTTTVLVAPTPGPNLGDRIDGRDVVARESITDIDGENRGWWLYL